MRLMILNDQPLMMYIYIYALMVTIRIRFWPMVISIQVIIYKNGMQSKLYNGLPWCDDDDS